MDIGTHCSFPSCNRLDFLPFTCDLCQGVFCTDHRVPDTHSCNGLPPDNKLSPPSSHSSSLLPLSLYPCSLADCKRREKVEIKCPYCQRVFCLQHRHQQDHSCVDLVVPKPGTSSGKGRQLKTAASVASGGKTLSSTARGTGSVATSTKVIRGARSKSMQAKVALMKLKLKAEGMESVPQSERVYYDVQLPRESGLPNKPMFFSKEWSVGKIVDVISNKYHLRNDNNRQGSQKLLLHSSEGEPLELSRALKTFLDDNPSGSLVILDYAADVTPS